MIKDAYKVIKILLKNKDIIYFKNHLEIYELIPSIKERYTIDELWNILYELKNNNVINGLPAGNKLNSISINEVEMKRIFEKRREDFWNNKINPILNGIIFPIIVSIVINIVLK